MKRIPSLVALSICTVLLFTSCQKESSNNPNPITGNDSYISKSYVVESSASGEDTLYRISYSYDAQKRVAESRDTSAASGAIPEYRNHTVYSYNSNDTVPFKSVSTSDGGGSSSTETVYYYYDASNRLTKDSSVINPGSWTVNNYEYAADKIYGFQYSNPAGFIITDTATVDASGNILSSIHVESIAAFPVRTTCNLTYTNRLNLYSKLSIRKTLGIFPNLDLSPTYTSTHDISHFTATETGSIPLSSDDTYTYILNSEGLVTEVREVDINYPGSIFKTIIFYTIL